MIRPSNKQFDLFSKEQSIWQRQSKQTTSQLLDQLALLLLSCLNANKQVNQTNMEDSPWPEKLPKST
jgi:hypothetical protein